MKPIFVTEHWREYRFSLFLAIAITVIFLVLSIVSYVDTELFVAIYVQLAFSKELVFGGEVYRLFTHMFLHASLLHLVGNAFGVVIFGSYVEKHIGTKRLLTYSAAGVVVMWAFLISLPEIPDTLAVGLSGYICFLATFATVYFINRYSKEDSLLLIIFLVMTFAVSFMPKISMVGHVAGVLAGLVVGLIALYRRRTDDVEVIVLTPSVRDSDISKTMLCGEIRHFGKYGTIYVSHVEMKGTSMSGMFFAYCKDGVLVEVDNYEDAQQCLELWRPFHTALRLVQKL